MNVLQTLAFGLSLVATLTVSAQQAQPAGVPPMGTPPAPFQMTVPAFADGAFVPVKFTCSAGDASVSPEIRWGEAPAATRSFMLVLADLEAHPDKSMVPFAHWILWNIPATVHRLPEGLPEGTLLADGTHQMKGRKGPIYLGPCAAAGPSGHYMFTLYALDSTLNLDADAQRDDIMKAATGHILRAANWVGLFHR